MNKCMRRLLIAYSLVLLGALGFLLSCGFENKADMEVYIGMYEYDFMSKHTYLKNAALNKITELETYVTNEETRAGEALREEVIEPLNSAINAAKSSALTTARGRSGRIFVSPYTNGSNTSSTWPQACCWAASSSVGDNGGTTGSVAPDDNGGRNTWGDTCYPVRASSITTGTGRADRWSSNYNGRTVTGHTDARGGAMDNGHWITFDLGASYMITGFRYRPRNSAAGGTGGRITGLDIYVSEIDDLARDPSSRTTGTHPGHWPPDTKRVTHSQAAFATDTNDWIPNNQTTNNISSYAYGRYVQFRMNKDNSNEVGAQGLEIRRDGTPDVDALTSITAPAPYQSMNMRQLINSFETMVAQAEAAAKQNAQAAALQELKAFVAEKGYSNGVIDFSYLETAYQQGIQLLGSLRLAPVKYRKLNEALNGKFNEGTGALVTRGAKQYLNGDPPPPAPFTSTSNDFTTYCTQFKNYLNGATATSFYGYQALVDAATEAIIALLETPPMAQ